MKKLLFAILSCVAVGCGKEEPPVQPPDENQMLQQSQDDQNKAARGEKLPAG